MKVSFQEWRDEARSPEFRTPSPAPNMDVFISNKEILFVRNYPYEYGISIGNNLRHRDWSIEGYFKIQAAILRYNNTRGNNSFSQTSCKMVLDRILGWRINRKLRDEPGDRVKDAIENAVRSIYSRDFDYLLDLIGPVIQMKCIWYSNKIESLPSGEKTSAKAKARGAMNAALITADIKEVSNEYRYENFDVKPTVAYVVDRVDYERTTVVKYGKKETSTTLNNIIDRVKAAKTVYPNYTQQEVADRLETSLRTVNRYWNK